MTCRCCSSICSSQPRLTGRKLGPAGRTAYALAALEPVQIFLSVTGTLSSTEHVRPDGLGIPKLVHSFGSGRSRRNRGWRWPLGPNNSWILIYWFICVLSYLLSNSEFEGAQIWSTLEQELNHPSLITSFSTSSKNESWKCLDLMLHWTAWLLLLDHSHKVCGWLLPVYLLPSEAPPFLPSWFYPSWDLKWRTLSRNSKDKKN